mgnify:FL=1
MSQPAAPAFRYAERRPAALLRPWIRNYWWFAVGPDAPAVHHVPPDGCTALVIHLDHPIAAMLSGPWLEPLGVPIRSGDRFGGVRLQPGALEPLLGIGAASMRDAVTPAPERLQRLAAELRRALAPDAGADALATTLDTLLAPIVAGTAPRDPLIAQAVDRLVATGGDLPIAVLARELGCAERTLRRQFGAATGVSPKEFARVRRVLAAAWAVARGGATWSAAAHAAGYADQPHLHRDVADFTGLTPGAFGKLIRATEHDEVVP